LFPPPFIFHQRYSRWRWPQCSRSPCPRHATRHPGSWASRASTQCWPASQSPADQRRATIESTRIRKVSCLRISLRSFCKPTLIAFEQQQQQQTNIKTNKQTNKERNEETNEETNKQASKQQTNKQTNKQKLATKKTCKVFPRRETVRSGMSRFENSGMTMGRRGRF
jgi:hypothetical protein